MDRQACTLQFRADSINGHKSEACISSTSKHAHAARQRCRAWRDTGPSGGSGTRDAAPTPASPRRTAASDACGPAPAPELAPLAFEPAWATQAGTHRPCCLLQVVPGGNNTTHRKPHSLFAQTLLDAHAQQINKPLHLAGQAAHSNTGSGPVGPYGLLLEYT